MHACLSVYLFLTMHIIVAIITQPTHQQQQDDNNLIMILVRGFSGLENRVTPVLCNNLCIPFLPFILGDAFSIFSKACFVSPPCFMFVWMEQTKKVNDDSIARWNHFCFYYQHVIVQVSVLYKPASTTNYGASQLICTETNQMKLINETFCMHLLSQVSFLITDATIRLGLSQEHQCLLFILSQAHAHFSSPFPVQDYLSISFDGVLCLHTQFASRL